MKRVILVLVAMFAIAAVASATSYKLDDAVVDNAIENAVVVSPLDLMNEVPAALSAGVMLPSSAPAAVISQGASPVGAILLTFFLGGFGIHRHYMGTRPWMWAIYTFTFGGIFGIVPFVDLIVEIIAAVEDNSVARYCGNTSFFMWG